MFCESPVDIANSENNYDATTNNRSAKYECHSGYRFDDMTTTATIDCVNGQWIASDANVLSAVTQTVSLSQTTVPGATQRPVPVKKRSLADSSESYTPTPGQCESESDRCRCVTFIHVVFGICLVINYCEALINATEHFREGV